MRQTPIFAFRVGLAVLAALGALAMPAVAAPEGKRARPDAAARAKLAAERGPVDAASAEKRVATVIREVKWQKDLAAALAQAKREQKMVLWLHVKGDLDGAT